MVRTAPSIRAYRPSARTSDAGSDTTWMGVPRVVPRRSYQATPMAMTMATPRPSTSSYQTTPRAGCQMTMAGTASFLAPATGLPATSSFPPPAAGLPATSSFPPPATGLPATKSFLPPTEGLTVTAGFLPPATGQMRVSSTQMPASPNLGCRGVRVSSARPPSIVTRTTTAEESVAENIRFAETIGMQDPISPKLMVITPEANFERFEEEEEDKKASVQHHVFNWLNWAPEPHSVCYNVLHKNFPGALPGPAVHHRITDILTGKYGFTQVNTLLGASICPDEINNEVGGLADLMKNYWGGIFPLGGISGAPFVGETGFGAFSHHVPDDGDIILVFGPHVAISLEGEVGKYLRHGQHHNSTACGAVIGAYNACSSSANKSTEQPINETDLQMEWIKAQIEPHVERIKAQSNPMGALAYQAYEMVRVKMEKIINLEFGSGRLVLIGGIQINMPVPFSDHFLPLMFEVRQQGRPAQNVLSAFQCAFTQNEVFVDPSSPVAPDWASASTTTCGLKKKDFNEWADVRAADLDHSVQAAEDRKAIKQQTVFAWLTWGPELGTPCFQTLHREFPGALPGASVHCRVRGILTDEYGFTPENTLFGNSICPDEINFAPGGIARAMADYWGEVFPLGGLGGAPFAGKTGYKAFSHHVPDDGNIFVLYGPHVGISESGEVGKYLREGQHELSTACGAVIGAYNACCGMRSDNEIEFDEADVQMSWIKSQIFPHCNRIRCQESPLAALAYQAYESVRYKINKVVDTDFGNGRLVLLGGILINMPAPCKDHFLPISFEVRQAGQPTEVLDGAFHIPFPNERDNFHLHAPDAKFIGA